MLDAFIAYVSLPLSESEVAAIGEASSERHVPEGTYLLQPGSTARELYFIVSGVLSIVVSHESGRDATSFFLTENKFCTILESFHRQVPAEEGIRAACDADLLVFRYDGLRALYASVPALERFIEQATRQTLLEKIRVRNTYLGLDASARYQQFLERQPDIVRRVALGDIAAYLEVTPQSLSRIRKNLQ